jgi:hypothetical protein
MSAGSHDFRTEYICQENNKHLRRLTDDFDQRLFK